MSRKKLIVITGVSILLLALVGGGVAYYFHHKSQTDAANADTTQQSTHTVPVRSGDTSQIKEVNGQPVQDVVLPGGKKTKAVANVLVVKTTNKAALAQFGTVTPLAMIPNEYRVKLTGNNNDLLTVAAEVKKKSGAEWVEPDYVDTANATAPLPRVLPTDPHWANPRSNLVDISAPEGWKITQGSSAVKIAIIDTGVSSTQADLRNTAANDQKIQVNSADPVDGVDNDGNGVVDDYYGMDFVAACTANASCTSSDSNGAVDGGAKEDDGSTTYHGTAMATIAAGNGNNGSGGVGVSWNASIIPVRVLGAAGQGDDTTIAMGIYYAVGRGANVISMSLGGGCLTGDPDSRDNCTSATFSSAIDFALAHNVTVIAASGNADQTTVGSPAHYAGVSDMIAVGGTEESGSTVKRSAGGEQTGTDGLACSHGPNYGAGLTISAPYKQYGAFNVIANANSFDSYCGTSGSTAMVSGAVASMVSLKPLTPHQVKAILMATADGPGGNAVGAGRINLYNALQAVNCGP